MVGKRLTQTVNSEGKSSLEPFSKEFKVLLLYSNKTVVSHLKIALPGGCNALLHRNKLDPFFPCFHHQLNLP